MSRTFMACEGGALRSCLRVCTRESIQPLLPPTSYRQNAGDFQETRCFISQNGAARGRALSEINDYLGSSPVGPCPFSTSLVSYSYAGLGIQ